LQSKVPSVGDDDSALVVDAHSLRKIELAWLVAFAAELEQERAIDRRQYLHSMVAGIRDDDSMSIMIDRNAKWRTELSRLGSSDATNREQEREIDRRQEHQSIVVGIDDDDAAMMVVDGDASRIAELEISCALLADGRQERLVAQ